MVLFRNHNRECWEATDTRIGRVVEGNNGLDLPLDGFDPLIPLAGQLHQRRRDVGHAMDQFVRVPVVRAVSTRLPRFRYRRLRLEVVFHSQQEQIKFSSHSKLCAPHSVSFGICQSGLAGQRHRSDDPNRLQAY